MKAITKIALFDGKVLYKAGDVIETKKFDPLTMVEYVEQDEATEEKPKARSTKKSSKK